MTTIRNLPLPAGALPARSGQGLKPEHFRSILDTPPELGFFEIHTDNYMDAYPTHGFWATVLLVLIARGPGAISLDHWLFRRDAPR